MIDIFLRRSLNIFVTCVIGVVLGSSCPEIEKMFLCGIATGFIIGRGVLFMGLRFKW